MRQNVILDTGPLVAFLNRKDKYHGWALEHWAEIEPPLLTCEAVISEACFLLSGTNKGQEAVMELLRRRVVDVAFSLSGNLDRIASLVKKYSRLPMSFADACLVRMAELYGESFIFTLDSHFKVYKKNRNKVIPILYPE